MDRRKFLKIGGASLLGVAIPRESFAQTLFAESSFTSIRDINDITYFTSRSNIGPALHIAYPSAASVVRPTARISKVNVHGPWNTAIRLENCWNAEVDSTFLEGTLSETQFANPTDMAVGLDLVGTMDAHIDRLRVTSAGVGLRARTHPSGFPRSEGLHLDKGWLMHVNTGVELLGSTLGGWPTPYTTLSNAHIAFNMFAVRADNVAFLHLNNVNCYATHYRRGQWCIYLTGCKKVTITDCDLWRNVPAGDPGFFGGIVLDYCEDVEITGGTVSDDIVIALHATPSCKNIRTNGKVWDALQQQGKVFNFAQ